MAKQSSLRRNVGSLYLLLGANYAIPLITIPYLVRVLGPTAFGSVAFAQGLIAYIVLLVNYGFDWTATRSIAVQRDEHFIVERTASSVWVAKVVLAAAG